MKLLAILASFAALAAAQIKITSPSDGDDFSRGQSLSVVVADNSGTDVERTVLIGLVPQSTYRGVDVYKGSFEPEAQDGGAPTQTFQITIPSDLTQGQTEINVLVREVEDPNNRYVDFVTVNVA